METMQPVQCGCGWKGNRQPGNLVFCPKCGQCAAFQVSDITAGAMSDRAAQPKHPTRKRPRDQLESGAKFQGGNGQHNPATTGIS